MMDSHCLKNIRKKIELQWFSFRSWTQWSLRVFSNSGYSVTEWGLQDIVGFLYFYVRCILKIPCGLSELIIYNGIQQHRWSVRSLHPSTIQKIRIPLYIHIVQKKVSSSAPSTGLRKSEYKARRSILNTKRKGSDCSFSAGHLTGTAKGDPAASFPARRWLTRPHPFLSVKSKFLCAIPPQAINYSGEHCLFLLTTQASNSWKMKSVGDGKKNTAKLCWEVSYLIGIIPIMMSGKIIFM